MKRFAEPRAEQAYYTGLAAGVPKHVSRRANWILQLLVDAHDWQDVGIIGRIAKWVNRPGRYGLHVGGKWFVTFAWESLVGATGIRLERR